jgi:hypothetical protein
MIYNVLREILVKIQERFSSRALVPLPNLLPLFDFIIVVQPMELDCDRNLWVWLWGY